MCCRSLRWRITRSSAQQQEEEEEENVRPGQRKRLLPNHEQQTITELHTERERETRPIYTFGEKKKKKNVYICPKLAPASASPLFFSFLARSVCSCRCRCCVVWRRSYLRRLDGWIDHRYMELGIVSWSRQKTTKTWGGREVIYFHIHLGHSHSFVVVIVANSCVKSGAGLLFLNEFFFSFFSFSVAV